MKPENESSLLVQAQSLLQQGNPAAAEQAYRQIISDRPDEPRAHFGLGKALTQLGRVVDAEQVYKQAIALDPDYFEALANLGSLCLFARRLGEALAFYARAEKIRPGNPEILSNLCYLHKELGDLDSARAHGLRALALNPDHVGALLNMGMVCNEAGRHEEAMQYLERANALSPGHPLVLHNMGVSLAGLRQYERARSCYLAALAKHPDSAPTLYGLGFVDKYLALPEEAKVSLKRVLELVPDDLAARSALAYLQLRLGEFREGWINHLARSLSTQDRTVPPMLPEQPQGAKVLLLVEQGLGDELLFLRFAPALKSRGMRLDYCGSLRLKPLLADQALFGEWMSQQANVNLAAYQSIVSIGNLPLVLGMASASDIPPPLKMQVAPALRERMAARLAPCESQRFIGVTWRAGTADSEELLYKEAPISALGDLLQDVPGAIIVLQRHPKAEEIEQLTRHAGRAVHDFSAANENLEEMLALLSLVDEYIGVSNTNMHLMAGLGRTARVLVPHPPEWRWMEEGRESPWFPGFQIYRQDRVGGWDEALGNLSQDLG
ncbi:MAG: tetratricopeptide repeat protein [Burkholderiales bacterium]|nr:tetratricopeptide repeat protein [Burkholderiales bacterium]